MMTQQNFDRLSDELVEGHIRGSRSGSVTVSTRSWLKAADVMSTEVATIRPTDTLISAAKTMSDNNISCLVVLDGDQLSGIVTEKDILKKAVAWGNDFRDMVVEQIMSSPVRTIPVGLSVMEAAEVMEEEGIRRLVVQDDGRAVGIITQRDMVRVLTSYTLCEKVSQIMTRDVAVVSHSATVKEAAEFMASRHISCLVIFNNDHVAGVFTERDLLKRVVKTERDPNQTEIQEVMSCPVITVPTDYSVSSASKLLERKKIRRLVVMDDEKLCGVITQTDILRAVNGRLQQEEQSYRRLLGESSHCIYITDMDFNTTYVNPAFMKLLEIEDPDEVIGKPFLPERFWEDPHQRDLLLDQMDKTRVEINELTLQTASDRRLYVTLFLTCRKDLHGHINGSQGVLYDVTAQKELVSLREMQQQLLDSEGRLNAMLHSIGDHVSLIDKDCCILWANKMARNMFGDDIVGRKCYQAYRGSDKPCEPYPCPTIAALNDGEIHQHETRLTDKDGIERHFQCTANVAIRNEAGEPTAVIEVARDITARKQAEEALRRAHQELEQRVRERTAELSQANRVLELEIDERKRAEQELAELIGALESTVQELNRSNKKLSGDKRRKGGQEKRPNEGHLHTRDGP
jgi:PAS domain S-box-containing protein